MRPISQDIYKRTRSNKKKATVTAATSSTATPKSKSTKKTSANQHSETIASQSGTGITIKIGTTSKAGTSTQKSLSKLSTSTTPCATISTANVSTSMLGSQLPYNEHVNTDMPLNQPPSSNTIARTMADHPNSSQQSENTAKTSASIHDLLTAAASNTNLNRSTEAAQNVIEHAEDHNEEENVVHDVIADKAGAADAEQVADYQLEAEFYTKEEWKQFLKLEGWATRTSAKLNKGKKITHRCNQMKSKGAQCAAGAYTLNRYVWIAKPIENEVQENEDEAHEPVMEEREVWQFYRNQFEHDHEGAQNQSKKLTDEITKQIIDWHLLENTPLAICFNLRNDLERIPLDKQPTYKQVYNVIENYRSSSYSKGRITMRQLTEFVNEHNAFPNAQDEDSGFIVAFDRSPSNEEDQWFRIFVSTRRLLQRAAGIKVIQADAAHKTTTEKLPLIVVGTTDMAQKFHFIGLAITTDETSSSYEFVFRALVHGIQRVTQTILDPDVLVADGDWSIRNGFHRVFGDENKKAPMCFPHVMANVQRKYKFANSGTNKENIKNYLRVLHNAPDEATFD